MALNLSKNQVDLERAARAVVDDHSPINWAVFGYEGHSNTLQVTATGDGNLEEMADNLSTGSCMYAFCRVKDPKTTLSKYVLIIWQGEGAPDTRRGICSNHIRPVTALFKGINLTLTARTEEEVEPAVILEKVAKASSSKFDFETSNRSASPPPAPVSSVYKKTVPSVEMSITKEREQFWQQQERDDGQRQQSETTQQSSVLPNKPQNKSGNIMEKAQVFVPPKPARLTEAFADSKKPNYVDLEKKKWEQTQKSTENSQPERKSSLVAERKASLGNQKVTPSSGKSPTGHTSSSGEMKGLDPVAAARAAEERRRFNLVQKESAAEERERRLKSVTMRQERLKEAQQLISARGSQDEPAVLANKSRTSSQVTSDAKSRSASTASSGTDVALNAYREEERRKFEQQQKESEADERERRLRSESLRQERLRELASLTQKKDTPVDDMFQSIGKSVKDKKQSDTKRGEDPEVVSRRQEEQRRWEEAQRETQTEEQERRMRAESLRQERAQEAAALIGGRSTASKAKSIFEQQSSNDHVASSSVNKVVKSHEQHHPSQRDRKLLADEEELHKVELERKNSHDLNENSHDNNLHDARDEVMPSPPPYPVDDEHEEIDHLSESFRKEVGLKNDAGTAPSGADNHHQQPISPPGPTVNAWKQGLPVRPPSDDEADADDWNESNHGPVAVHSPASGSGSDHGHGLQARALYDYQAGDETEISFDPGDIITNIDKVDSGWYQGMAVNGTYGLFPANYVEML